MRAGGPAARSASSRRWSTPCTRRAWRSARRRLQPHRRGRPTRPHAVPPRPGQRRPTTGSTPADPSRYLDTTGCGNSLNAADPFALQLIMDSLRYWLTEMHVDGFRFDLAPTLARAGGRVRPAVRLLRPGRPRTRSSRGPSSSPNRGTSASPTATTSAGSRRCGGNGTASYRDTMRDFWRSHDGLLGEFATRFAGSADLYGGARRRPTASVNLITVHDGFTLATWSPTTTSTTRRTGRTTGTAPTTTGPGTAAPRARPTTRPC